MHSYVIVRIIPTIAILIPKSWYFVMGIDYFNNSSTSIEQP